MATAGPLGEAATIGRAHGGDRLVRLLLCVLAVVSSGGEDQQQLMVAVNGGGAPVGHVGQGANILVVVLSELQADCSGEAV